MMGKSSHITSSLFIHVMCDRSIHSLVHCERIVGQSLGFPCTLDEMGVRERLIILTPCVSFSL